MYLKTLLPTALAVIGASAQMMNLTSLLASNSNLTALTGLLSGYPQFATAVANRTNVTLFAPSNQALSMLNQSGALAAAASQSNFIQDLLSYHLLDGMYYASNITMTPAFPHTNLNDTIYSNVTGGQVVECRLMDTTVEIISGMKSIANVTQANLNYTGGVIHVIDSVLEIPSNVSTTADAANLTALIGLLEATNLTDTVDTASDITVFAPSNDAFQNIASAAGSLTMSELMQIAEYHVINGTVAYSSSLGNGTVKALSGGNLTITVADGSVFVNAARVINADILISGGVMHIIDSVLNPNNTSMMPNSSESGGVTAYSGASSGTMVPLTSGVPSPTVPVTGLVATTTEVAMGYSTPAGSGAVGGAAGSGSATAAMSSSSSGLAPAVMPTGAIGAAALFGGAAVIANL